VGSPASVSPRSLALGPGRLVRQQCPLAPRARAVSRGRNQRRARIRNQHDRLFGHFTEKSLAPRPAWSSSGAWPCDLQMISNLPVTRVSSQATRSHRATPVGRPRGDVAKIADGRGDDIEPWRKRWCFAISMDRPFGSGKQMMTGLTAIRGISGRDRLDIQALMDGAAAPRAWPPCVAAALLAGCAVGPGASPSARRPRPKPRPGQCPAHRFRRHRVALLVPLSAPMPPWDRPSPTPPRWPCSTPMPIAAHHDL
jgi:hypothetical protein